MTRRGSDPEGRKSPVGLSAVYGITTPLEQICQTGFRVASRGQPRVLVLQRSGLS